MSLNFLKPKLISIQVDKDHFLIRPVAKDASPMPVFPDGLSLNRTERSAEALKKSIASLRSRWDVLNPVLVMQAVDIALPLTETERKPLKDALLLVGASRVHLLADPFHPLTDDEIRQIAGYASPNS